MKTSKCTLDDVLKKSVEVLRSDSSLERSCHVLFLSVITPTLSLELMPNKLFRQFLIVSMFVMVIHPLPFTTGLNYLTLLTVCAFF